MSTAIRQPSGPGEARPLQCPEPRPPAVAPGPSRVREPCGGGPARPAAAAGRAPPTGARSPHPHPLHGPPRPPPTVQPAPAARAARAACPATSATSARAAPTTTPPSRAGTHTAPAIHRRVDGARAAPTPARVGNRPAGAGRVGTRDGAPGGASARCAWTRTRLCTAPGVRVQARKPRPGKGRRSVAPTRSAPAEQMPTTGWRGRRPRAGGRRPGRMGVSAGGGAPPLAGGRRPGRVGTAPAGWAPPRPGGRRLGAGRRRLGAVALGPSRWAPHQRGGRRPGVGRRWPGVVGVSGGRRPDEGAAPGAGVAHARKTCGLRGSLLLSGRPRPPRSPCTRSPPGRTFRRT